MATADKPWEPCVTVLASNFVKGSIFQNLEICNGSRRLYIGNVNFALILQNFANIIPYTLLCWYSTTFDGA